MREEGGEPGGSGSDPGRGLPEVPSGFRRQEGERPGKKEPLAQVTERGDAPQQGDVPPARRRGESEAGFFPQGDEPGVSATGTAALPAAQREGEPAAHHPPQAAAPEVTAGALPSAVPPAQRRQDDRSYRPDRPLEGAPAGTAQSALSPAKLTQEPGLLQGGEPAAQEVEAATEPPRLPLAQRTKQAALPTPPATQAPTALLPTTAVAPVPSAPAAVSEVAPVGSALRKQEPEPPQVDEEPFVLKGQGPAPAAEGRIVLTGVTIDKNGLSLFTSGKVSDFRMITLVEPYSLVIDLVGAVNGVGLDKAPVEKFDLSHVRFRAFPEYLQITLDAEREEIIPYRSFKTDDGLRIDIKPRSSHHIGP